MLDDRRITRSGKINDNKINPAHPVLNLIDIEITLGSLSDFPAL
jgi:hypothetical protein